MEKTTKAPKRPQKRKNNEFALHATVILLSAIMLVIFGMIWRCARKPEKTEPNIEYITDSISTTVPDTLPTPTSPAIRTEEVSNAASQSSGNNSYGEYEYASSSKSYNCGYDNGFEDGECDALDGNFHGSNYDDALPSSRYDGEQYRLGYEEGYDDGFREGKCDRDDEEDDEVEDYW